MTLRDELKVWHLLKHVISELSPAGVSSPVDVRFFYSERTTEQRRIKINRDATRACGVQCSRWLSFIDASRTRALQSRVMSEFDI